VIQLNLDLIELLEAFEKFGVRYLVIGGYAVSIYGEPRYTKDIDFWIATDRRNAEAVHAALRHFGARLHGNGPEDLRTTTLTTLSAKRRTEWTS
jgi:uncharacterized protein (DUF1330 family)